MDDRQLKPIEKLASALQECLDSAVERGAKKVHEEWGPRFDRQDETLRLFWKHMKGKGPLPVDED